MLETFVTCSDCECSDCLRAQSCPKTDMIENPCIDCVGMPPYAPWNTVEPKLCDIHCDKYKPCFVVKD